jgi:hypothetical protein
MIKHARFLSDEVNLLLSVESAVKGAHESSANLIAIEHATM